MQRTMRTCTKKIIFEKQLSNIIITQVPKILTTIFTNPYIHTTKVTEFTDNIH